MYLCCHSHLSHYSTTIPGEHYLIYYSVKLCRIVWPEINFGSYAVMGEQGTWEGRFFFLKSCGYSKDHLKSRICHISLWPCTSQVMILGVIFAWTCLGGGTFSISEKDAYVPLLCPGIRVKWLHLSPQLSSPRFVLQEVEASSVNKSLLQRALGQIPG